MTDIKYTHAEDEILEQYALGKLPEAAVEPLEEHLLLCDSCQVRLDETELFIRSMRGAMDEAARQPQPARRTLWARAAHYMTTPAPAWAGAFAVLALIGGVASQFHRKPAGPPAPIELSAMRGGAESTATRQPIELHFDPRTLPAASSYKIQIVNETGGPVWESPGTPAQGKLAVTVTKNLAPGHYFVRAYGADAELLLEYGLTVK